MSVSAIKLYVTTFLPTDIRKEQDPPCRAKKDTLLPFIKPSTISFYLWF